MDNNCPSNNFGNNLEKALKKIEHDSKFKPTCCISPTGVADTITIRNTTTGDPGTDARVEDVTGRPNHVLDFVIPRGFDWNIGPQGEVGPT